MANTIKLKQGSGSDPSASDLVLGEPAIRTDTGEIFLKKDDGTIAKVAGGIDDGDKGDITVSSSGTVFTIDNRAVTTGKFQSFDQNRILGRIASGSGDATLLTAANVRTMINVENGATADQTAAEIRALVESASDSNVFTDADHSKLNGIASGATNVTNTNQLTNGAGFITATLTNEQVQDIVGGMVTGNTESGITVTYQDGDGTLDFSVASQTDNNFTNADHSKLDGIEAGATADQTASEILTLLKTVDGSGSGLDADTLDGANASVSASNSTIVQRHSSGYIFANFFNTTPNTVSSGVTQVCVETGNDGYIRHGTAAAIRTFINVEDGATADQSASEILTLLKTVDGAGSGLDADTLDGVSSGEFLRSNAADTANSDIIFNGGAGAATIAAHSDISFTNGNWTGNHTKIQHHSSRLYIVGGSDGIFFREAGTDRWRIDGGGHFDPASDSTYDIGASDVRVRVGYFDEVDSAEVRVNNGILETKATIGTSHSLTSGFNAMAVSPTINSGVTITVPSGAVWAIV